MPRDEYEPPHRMADGVSSLLCGFNRTYSRTTRQASAVPLREQRRQHCTVSVPGLLLPIPPWGY
jgi:hypothetical protein